MLVYEVFFIAKKKEIIMLIEIIKQLIKTNKKLINQNYQKIIR